MAGDCGADRVILCAEGDAMSAASGIRRIAARLRTAITGHDAGDADLRAEMESHLALEIDEHVRRGLPVEQARRKAMMAAGGFTQASESVREQRGLPWIEGLVADLRFAARHFRRTPLATTTMVLVLSIGIGANVVLFTMLNSMMTMPAPGMSRDASVVRIRGSMSVPRLGWESARLMSWPEVSEYAARTDLFTGVAAWADESATFTRGDATAEPATVHVIYATTRYLSVLGLRPSLGTGPYAGGDDTRLTASPSVMISEPMWQQWFGGAQDVIGSTVRINGTPVQIAGVAPARFLGTDGGRSMTVWAPLAAYPLLQHRAATVFSSRDSTFLRVAARLRADVTVEKASPVVTGIAARSTQARADSGAVADADIVPMLASNSRATARTDMIMSSVMAGGSALLILLITCTNVSALLVGMAVARRREIGVRISLGAPRRRLVRQLLTESILLALTAAAVALLVTYVGIRALSATLADVQLVIDWRVTAGTCAIALATGILFGISPALHATRASVSDTLKGSGSSEAPSRAWLQRALVVAQITLTQPLLVGLGVVIVTMATDMRSGPGSAVADRIVEIELDPWSGRVSDEERSARIAAAVERVRSTPGVIAAVPMETGSVRAPLRVADTDRAPGVMADAMDARLVAAPAGYFRAFSIPFVRGRDFDASEYAYPPGPMNEPLSVNAVIIGSDLAQKLWGETDAVGRHLTMPGAAGTTTSMTVVGVVDAAVAGPSEVNDEIRVYVPYARVNAGVIARTAGPAMPLLNTLRQVVSTEAPQMPVQRAETMSQRVARERTSLMRTGGTIAAGGILALILSAIGLYGVVASGVGQRTQEIGIRTALGAQPGQVVGLFFGRGLRLGLIGLALGLPLSIIAVRMISATLAWPLETSPLVGIGIGAITLAVASLAVWIPARRASAIDPLVALRIG